MGYVFGAACSGLSCLSYAQQGELILKKEMQYVLSTTVAASSLGRMPLSMRSSTQVCFAVSELIDGFLFYQPFNDYQSSTGALAAARQYNVSQSIPGCLGSIHFYTYR